MKFLQAIFVIFLVQSCASVKPLDGGDKDTTPPIIKSYSPDSAALNTNPSEIVITFDEYIKGEKLNQNIIISPRPKTSPDITVKGKQLRINFNERLNENSTYTILLNNAIKDVNEGNILPTSKYIFSTGNTIDSLLYTGTIINAYTKEKCENCILALYESENDSIILQDRPLYLNTSNNLGRSEIGNLPDIKLKAYAFNDENKNLVLDPDELVSLSKNVIFGSKDTFYIFPYTNAKKFSKPSIVKRSKPYSIQLTSKTAFPSQTTIAVNDVMRTPVFSMLRDTLSLVDSSFRDSLFILIGIDTTTYTYTKFINKKRTSYPIQIVSSYVSKDTLVINTNTFVKSIDANKLKVITDSLELSASLINLHQSKISLLINSKEFESGKVYLEENAIEDIYNNTCTKDTIIVNQKINNLPNLTLKINKTSDYPLVLQLLNKQGEIVKLFKVTASEDLVISNVMPGNYSVRTIIDSNSNGQWDGGNILSNKQPETVKISESFEMRIDWDKELIINH